MRILLLIAGAAVLASGIIGRADDRKFPYEAIVDADDGEFVLSGPGKKFYPTQKLQKGDRVMVHRHDFGWCMIAPPPESFSWIRAEHVQRSGDSGVLNTNRVVVHVGSALNVDDVMIVQGSLSKGDPVEILGEREFAFDDGARLMYKIRPVKREWRWIARKSIVAADAIKSDPFPVEQPARKNRRSPVADMDPDNFARPISTSPAQRDDNAEGASSTEQKSSENGAVRRTGPNSDQPGPGRQKLNEIDQQFREMIRLDPPEWNLDSLETQYQQLDDDVGQASLTTLIAPRLDAVKRYRKIHKDYVDFYKLTSETKQRDAQLLSLQAQRASDPQANGLQGGMAPSSPAPSPSGDGSQPATSTLQPSPQQPSPQQPSPQPPTAGQAAPQQPGSAPMFDGAGIVQKMAKTFPGGPQFVLIAPDGRMLSFLQPTQGIDLNRYVGRSMGIIGRRVRRDEWNADVIVVRSLQPVQLRDAR